jgi:ankyrin repeat protein
MTPASTLLEIKLRKSGPAFSRFLWLLVMLSICCSASHGTVRQISAERDCDTPLIAAIHKGDLQSARKIIHAGADLNDKTCGVTALTESIAERHQQLAKELILAGADVTLPDTKGASPLIYASFYCETEIVSLLLERKAAVNATDSDGDSALMHAAAIRCPGEFEKQNRGNGVDSRRHAR